MKTLITSLAALAAVILTPVAARADLEVGKPAPAIVSKDINGKEWKLADQKGKYVVLEWYNPECPFVKKFYNVSKMQEQQKKLAAEGVVWVSIYSTNDEIKEKKSASDLQKVSKDWKTVPAATLYDGNGAVARAYFAKTTPHVFIIDPQGTLIYRGAIDSIRSSKAEDIAKAENYVDKTLAESKAGKPVSTPVTKSYGCGVKI
ncbi:MAG: redoxin domain-containing protein [Puniceicoccales bacterium]|jgi:peroxiredoxin|nr:redoxin domain-containing protein [Puniceicoccales bacterium]